MSHPAIWQYGLTVAWTAAVTAIALAGPWRRDPFGPPGAVAAMTVLIVGLDVITGSRLQLGSPFGLSVLEGGRFYGIGGAGIGLYAVCAVIAIAWWATRCSARPARPPWTRTCPPWTRTRPPRTRPPWTGPRAAERGHRWPWPTVPDGRGRALLAASAVALFAVIACGCRSSAQR